jgi:N-acetylglucosaminyl-diphospho-decaprenol L-rhamnosyltransferase
MIKLSIVILSYNTKDLTLECLKSISSIYEEELEKKTFEIIVVDNNSSDDSIRNIKKEFLNKSYITIVENKENLGFGKGCNLGVKNSNGKYLLFLNSDTEVLDKGFLNMIQFLENNSQIAILGGKLINLDGSLQLSVGKFYNLFNLLIMLSGLERIGFLRSSPDEIKKVDWVSGACMMVKREIFEKLSGFDEKIFMYIEDMEICYRMKKLGYETFFFPDIKLKHKSLGSSNRTFAIINIYKGILHFYSKHKSHFEYMAAKMLMIIKAKILISIGYLTFNSEIKDRYKKAIHHL